MKYLLKVYSFQAWKISEATERIARYACLVKENGSDRQIACVGQYMLGAACVVEAETLHIL